MDIGNPDLVLIAWRALAPPSESLRWIRQKALPSPVRIIVLADRDEYGAAVRALEGYIIKALPGIIRCI